MRLRILLITAAIACGLSCQPPADTPVIGDGLTGTLTDTVGEQVGGVHPRGTGCHRGVFECAAAPRSRPAEPGSSISMSKASFAEPARLLPPARCARHAHARRRGGSGVDNQEVAITRQRRRPGDCAPGHVGPSLDLTGTCPSPTARTGRRAGEAASSALLRSASLKEPD